MRSLRTMWFFSLSKFLFRHFEDCFISWGYINFVRILSVSFIVFSVLGPFNKRSVFQKFFFSLHCFLFSPPGRPVHTDIYTYIHSKMFIEYLPCARHYDICRIFSCQFSIIWLLTSWSLIFTGRYSPGSSMSLFSYCLPIWPLLIQFWEYPSAQNSSSVIWFSVIFIQLLSLKYFYLATIFYFQDIFHSNLHFLS